MCTFLTMEAFVVTVSFSSKAMSHWNMHRNRPDYRRRYGHVILLKGKRKKESRLFSPKHPYFACMHMVLLATGSDSKPFFVISLTPPRNFLRGGVRWTRRPWVISVVTSCRKAIQFVWTIWHMVFPPVPFMSPAFCGIKKAAIMEKCFRALPYQPLPLPYHAHASADVGDVLKVFRVPFLVGAWLGRIPWDSRLGTDHSISVTGTSEKPFEKRKYV